MVPVRWVRLPPHGTAGKKDEDEKKQLILAVYQMYHGYRLDVQRCRESKIRYMHTDMHKFAHGNDY